MTTADRFHLYAQVTAVREIYIPHQKLDEIQSDLEILRSRENGGSEGGILFLTGPSRSGKTKVLADYERLHPEQPGAIQKPNGEFATRKPVVRIKVPDGNEKNLTERLLAKMLGVSTHDVKGMGSRRIDIQEDIWRVAEETETRLVMLDETHQGIGRNGNNAAVVATLLKDLANGRIFGLAIAGTEQARMLQAANKEFALRCIYDYTLEPLAWDEPRDRKILLDVLQEYDQHLCEHVFGRLSGLTKSDLASTLCIAGGGLIGSVAVLIETGGNLAVDAMLAGEAKCLTLDHLGKAFRKSAARHDVDRDPFPENLEAAAPAPAPDIMTGLKGRTRHAGHDVQFRR